MKYKTDMDHIIKYSIYILLVLTISSCEKDQPDIVEVDSRLQIYFDRFVVEGAERGVTVDFDVIEVSGKIEEITDGSQVAGQCQSNSARANVLIIDLDFWNGANNLEKEFVIFHELGHCYLDRSHFDEANADGTCVSMMHSGTSGCTNTYNSTTRSAYIDELFNP